MKRGAEKKERADAGARTGRGASGWANRPNRERERKSFPFFSNFQTNFEMQIQINLKFDFQTTQYKNNMQQHECTYI